MSLSPQDPTTGATPTSGADPNAAMPIAPFQSPDAPQKPSLWRQVLAGALTGLAGSAHAKGFATGAAGGAGAELNQIAADKATDAATAKANDEHMQAQANIANTYVTMAHTMAMMRQMDPNSVQSLTKSYNDRMAKGIETGALVPAGPSGEYADVMQQVSKLHSNDPQSLYMPVQVSGPDGKKVWQVFKASNAPLQADAKVEMPDKSTRTLPAGQFTGQDWAKINISNTQDEAKGMVQEQVNAAKPVKPSSTYKVSPVPVGNGPGQSPTGYGYMGPDENGDLKKFHGPAPAPSAQTFSQTKTETRISTADGLPHIYQFDPQTNTFSHDNGLSASGTFGGQAAKAAVIYKSGEDLKTAIRDNAKLANSTQLGTLEAWVKEKGIDTPIGDPKLAKIQASIMTYVALQPGFHGFRSHEALQEFHQAVGYLHTNPDVLIANIDAIGNTAKNANPALKNISNNQPTNNNTPQPMFIVNRQTGERRKSTDGGKTWATVPAGQ